MSDTTSPGQPHSGSDRLKDTAREAKDAASERLSEVGDAARRGIHDAKHQASAEAERAKNAGAGRLRELSDALGHAADDMGDASTTGGLMRQASEGIDEVARSLEGQSLGEMVDTVSDFGRRNPTLFLGGAALAGFALSRFATASQPRQSWDEADDDRVSRRATGEVGTHQPRSPFRPQSAGTRTSPAAAAGSSGGVGGDTDADALKLTPGMQPNDDSFAGSGTTPAARPAPSAGESFRRDDT